MAGYNENFESFVEDGVTYNSYYIKFNEYDKSAYQWGDYIYQDSMVIIAVPTGTLTDEVEATMDAVVDNVLAIQTAFISQVPGMRWIRVK